MNLADGPARGCEKAASAARTAAVRAVATWLADQANVARVAELADSSAIFLVNPGIVIVGKDLQTATAAAVLLERACAQQMLTYAFGRWPAWSVPEESLSKRANIDADGPIRAVSDYLARSLG
ncbi:MAG TPA: class II aldolase/adducin family protein [Streptosporangiaceae bacterium]|jgi:L-fuculose-phosphate aldolase|nr:class II aldolase/adducin family protein [Streptosporangiaceae bacterium]